MYYNGQSFRAVKKPTLNPTKLDDQLLLKLLISGGDRQSKVIPIKNRDYDEHQHHETLRKKFGADYRKRLAFLDEYPEKFKQLTEMKKELSALFNVDITKWCFEEDIASHIKKLKVLANETERKLKIANEIETLKNKLDRDMSNLIDKYRFDPKQH